MSNGVQWWGMERKKEKKVTIDIPKGTALEIDGELHYVESGTLVYETDFLYGVGDPPNNPSMMGPRQCTIDVELYEPESDE